MRPITTLFYAIAILCLGSIAWIDGGPRMLAFVFGGQDTAALGNWQSWWAIGTLVLTVVFLTWTAALALRGRHDS